MQKFSSLSKDPIQINIKQNKNKKSQQTLALLKAVDHLARVKNTANIKTSQTRIESWTAIITLKKEGASEFDRQFQNETKSNDIYIHLHFDQ